MRIETTVKTELRGKSINEKEENMTKDRQYNKAHLFSCLRKVEVRLINLEATKSNLAFFV